MTNLKDEDLAAALLKGIKEAKTGGVKQVYNAASGLLKGLQALRSLEGSKLEYTVTESGESRESLSIKTNIPAEKDATWGAGVVTATVRPNGRIEVTGDVTLKNDATGFITEEFSSKRRSATEKALTFIAKKATQKGLIL